MRVNFQDQVQENSLASIIDGMINEHGFKYFSVTRVDPTASTDWINRFYSQLDEIFTWRDPRYHSFSLPQAGKHYNSTHSKVYIIGDEQKVNEDTKKLSLLVYESKTGVLYDKIREDIANDSNPKKWLAKLVSIESLHLMPKMSPPSRPQTIEFLLKLHYPSILLT